MNEIVRDAVDVPGDADRIDKTKNQHDPERKQRKKQKHAEEVSAMEKGRENRDHIPASVGKDPGIRLRAFDACQFR